MSLNPEDFIPESPKEQVLHIPWGQKAQMGHTGGAGMSPPQGAGTALQGAGHPWNALPQHFPTLGWFAQDPCTEQPQP